VVWTALNLIQGCEDDPGSCGLSKKRDNRFNILSGTSTGAMIATGVDRFNAARTRAERRAGIDNIAKWFTCYSLNDLYCVESAPITKLAKHQRGVLRFDGICQMLNSCVDQGMLDNESELVLNTTDFRSGRLFHLSDQGELSSKVDVIHAALASAELPSIVVPEPALKVDVGDQPRQRGAFLDGGVRSEVPLMAAVLRGAERALVVSSSPWLLGDTRPLPSALSIAQRYIDVSTGGVAETDIAGALRRVESVRFAEFQACLQAVTHFGLGCGRGGCDALRLCEARFEQVCSHEAVHQNAEPHVDERHLSVRVRDRIHALWQSEMIFRNAGEVDAAHGYSFDPEDLRRLFRAGAEAGRQRCIHIAMLLGIVDPSSEPSQSLRDGLMGHCNQRLADDLCGRGGRASGEDVAIRDCSEASTIDLGVCGGMPTADAWMCAPQWHLDSRAGGGQ
jgi:predicted acylesterase/phospholipase RssA